MKKISQTYLLFQTPILKLALRLAPHPTAQFFFYKQYNVIQKLEILGKNRHILRLQYTLCRLYKGKSIREEVTVCVKVIVIKIEC